MTRYLFLFLSLLVTGYCSAQEQMDYRQIADKHFDRYEYAEAAPVYERLAAKRNPASTVYYKLAYCYEQMQQYDKALLNYKKYYSRDTADHKAVLVNMGDLQKTLQQYDAAKASYAAYLLANTDTTGSIQRRSMGCDSAIKWSHAKSAYSIFNEAGLNTNLSDWGAVPYEKAQVVFTSEDQKKEILEQKSKKSNGTYGWTGNPYLKLYIAHTRQSTGGENAIITNEQIFDFGAFANNSKYHVGPAAFTNDYKEVFFTVTNKDNDRQQVHAGRNGLKQRNLELYYSVKDNTGAWTAPVAFPYNNSAKYSVGHATFSKDGNTLYFVSDMPGGYGKTDIWYSEKGADGKWQTPQNGGSKINTPDEEAFPVMAANGSLYFASTGHPGAGGYDIFIAKGAQNNWQEPRNVQLPLNSSYDDFSLSMKEDNTGYFSSNRPGGKGKDDIYSFTAKALPALVLKTIFIDRSDSSFIENGRILLRETGAESRWVRQTDYNGSGYFLLDKEKTYTVNAAYKDLKSETLTVAGKGTDMDTITRYIYVGSPAPMMAAVAPAPFKVGDKFVLEDLYYDYNKYNIRPDAALVLDKLVATLRQYPLLEIELSSHTDCRGSDSYNMTLSQNRAESAIRYLQSQGINVGRLRAKGFGETRLLNKCANGVECTEPEHQLNRRTEVRILKV